MSRWAFGCVLAERWANESFVRSWRSGSVVMLWQISVRRFAVMSQISLCLIVGIQPIWHIMEWSTEKEAPQLHKRGRLLSFHQYLRHRASQNSPLFSHDEDPFSWASCSEHWSCGFSRFTMSFACFSCLSLLLFFTLFLSFLRSFVWLWWSSCLMIRATRGAVTWFDASKAWVNLDVGLMWASKWRFPSVVIWTSVSTYSNFTIKYILKVGLACRR